MEKTYDMIVSLGGNCMVAVQLRHRGMRPYSLPLDWTYMNGVKGVEKLPELIRGKFSGFCLYENMKDLGNVEKEAGLPTYRFEDTATGFCFIHQFHAPLTDPKGFAADRAIVQKRINRMYDNVNRSKSVLFVLETPFEFNDSLVRPLYLALKETFFNTNVHLLVIQFNSKSCADIDIDSNIHITRHTRDLNVIIDVYGSSPEWSWMDQMRLTGLPKAAERRKHNLLIKLKYKLWKVLGKSLHRDGAGCISMLLP